MSKAMSHMFVGTSGAKEFVLSRFLDDGVKQQQKKAVEPPAVPISSEKIRFSQTSVNGSAEIIESMRKNGWKGEPINVVVMGDGGYATLDNTRLVAAKTVGIEVQAIVHQYSDPLPSEELVQRFTTSKGGRPSTWGQAVDNRIKKQNHGFSKKYPYGDYNIMDVR